MCAVVLCAGLPLCGCDTPSAAVVEQDAGCPAESCRDSSVAAPSDGGKVDGSASRCSTPDGGGLEVLVCEGGEEDCGAPRIVSGTWSALSETGAPTARTSHVGVWTGRCMLIWGGLVKAGIDAVPVGDGACYDPTIDSWRGVPAEGAPSPRHGHSAIWTGDAVFIWGGAGSDGLPLGDGALLDPVTMRWTPVPAAAGVLPRYDHVAVWTGSEVLIWGGLATSGNVKRGGLFDPRTLAWRTLEGDCGPPCVDGCSAAWTGHRVVVAGTSVVLSGGEGSDGRTAGDRWANVWQLEPRSSDWGRLLSGAATPLWHAFQTIAALPGGELVLWGGETYEGSSRNIVAAPGGFRLTLDEVGGGNWQCLPSCGAPPPGIYGSAATDFGLLVWGYAHETHALSGGLLDVRGRTWQRIAVPAGLLAATRKHSAVWTGDSVLVWGGLTTEGDFSGSGAAFSFLRGGEEDRH